MKTERDGVEDKKRNRQKKTQKCQKKTNPSRCIRTRGNHVYQPFLTIVTKPLQSAYTIMRACGYTIQWRIQGANPAMAPIEVGNGVWPPLEEERIMRVAV